MKQLSRIISTYTSDVSGVCSALYELGGMVVIHDASGCNSSYTTFDEPRWYDMDSMIYGSGLDETDAMLGNDDKLINDVVNAASEMRPNFIAVAGGPVPMMIGTDFTGIAEVIEKRTGIPTFGFFTNGMNFYNYGAGLALEALAKRFCKEADPVLSESGGKASVNIIGATPLDFSIKENIPSLRALFQKRGYRIVSVWAMGSSFEELTRAGAADVNVVVSSCGLAAACYLRKKFGTPYAVGLPIGSGATDEFFSLVDKAAADGKNQVMFRVSNRNTGNSNRRQEKALIIGEQVYADSLRCCLKADYYFENVRTLCPLDPDPGLLLPGDGTESAETDIEKVMAEYDVIFADPIYRHLLPAGGKKSFVDMPHEAFSGRICREESPCLIGEAIHSHIQKYL